MRLKRTTAGAGQTFAPKLCDDVIHVLVVDEDADDEAARS